MRTRQLTVLEYFDDILKCLKEEGEANLNIVMKDNCVTLSGNNSKNYELSFKMDTKQLLFALGDKLGIRVYSS